MAFTLAEWSLFLHFKTCSECRGLQANSHMGAMKTMWKPKAIMRGRMTVFQFLVILTVKAKSNTAFPTTHLLHIVDMKVGGRVQIEKDTACTFRSMQHCLSVRWNTTSDIFVFQEVGPLQHLYMTLIDFECRAEPDRQTSQHVAALH